MVRAEHWDGLWGGGLLGDHQSGITERGRRARRDVGGQFCLPPTLASHGWGWRAECAHESPPHSFAIRKAGLPRDGLDGMPTVFQHQPGGLETKFLDGLCRRLAGLGSKRSCELAGGQMGRLRPLFYRKLSVEIFPRGCESGLNSVGLRLKLEKSRELRLSAGTPMMDHHFLRNRPSEFRTDIPFDHCKDEIHRRGHTRRCPYRTVDDEYPIFLHLHLRITSLKFARVVPVRRHPFSVEKTRFGQREVADASRGHPAGYLGTLPQVHQQSLRRTK